MDNPFNQKNEKEKHEFFKQITEAINEWMLKQYPAFDTELINKIREIRIYQEEVKTLVQDFKSDLIKDAETIKDRLFQKVNDFIKNEHPSIHDSIKNEILNIKKVIKKHKDNVDLSEKKLNEIIHSGSIYEDVYKMRDEFKDIKKFIDTLQNKIKKVFEL